MQSGLYAELVESGRLVPHAEVSLERRFDERAHAVLAPVPLPFISYPFEWCPGQLRDAGLATLQIQKRALVHGMVLKDATAYNIQFHNGRPVHIDLLSFERARGGEPWVAYRQFCEHFVAPLALARYRDVRLLGLLRAHLEGIPLDVASRLLPWHTWLRPSLFIHVHAHAWTAARLTSDGGTGERRARVGRRGVAALTDSLERCVRRLDWTPPPSAWRDYTSERLYSEAALSGKRDALVRWLSRGYERVVDAGANVGEFSRLAAEHAPLVISLDGDYASVERHYRQLRADTVERIVPLVVNLANPSPGLGWDHAERESLFTRCRGDVVLALALVHHLTLSAGAPLDRVASLLTRFAPAAIVEYVPRDDPQARRLVANRHAAHEYDRAGFEAVFAQHFRIAQTRELPESGRILYQLEPE